MLRKINWKVRAKNQYFWIALIPAALVLVQMVLALFGINWQPDALSDQLIAIVNAVFVVLGILGIVVDPTTKGSNDTDQAMGYESPREEENTAPDEEESEEK